jgi:hypothetical protein
MILQQYINITAINALLCNWKNAVLVIINIWAHNPVLSAKLEKKIPNLPYWEIRDVACFH